MNYNLNHKNKNNDLLNYIKGENGTIVFDMF